MGKIKRTTRFSPKHIHDEFGIQKWLKSRKIFTKKDCDTTVDEFCKKNGFVYEGRKEETRKKMYAFTSKRFQEFIDFQLKREQ